MLMGITGMTLASSIRMQESLPEVSGFGSDRTTACG